MAREQGIRLKKKFGQHFLRNNAVLDQMIQTVSLDKTTNVFEIGCGDGVLTERILATPVAHLWVFEIDPEWATYVGNKFSDKRLTIFQENFLDIDMDRLMQADAPWVLLANLPYQVTFPILYQLQKNAHLLSEAVVMVQEEVALKITKQSGRGYGFISLFFQWYFDWRLLMKIPPTAFVPPPKVHSRLLYCRPKKNIPVIPHEERFWSFVKLCFAQPRRTLRNNLKQCHYTLDGLSPELFDLRAQQLSMEQLLQVWEIIRQQLRT